MPQYSDIMAQAVANTLVRNPVEPRDAGGRVRLYAFKLTVGAADTDMRLARLPAGRIRILGNSTLKVSFTTGATTLAVGLAAYTKQDGTTQAAVTNNLKTATAGSTITIPLDAAGPRGLPIDSREGVDIVGTTSANLAVNDTIEGVIYYAYD